MNDLSQIRFLVIDEADRMIQQGSFPQLVRILDEIHKANPMDDDDDKDDDSEDDQDEDDNQGPKRLSSLPGIPGEAKVHMLSDELLQQLQKQQEHEEGDVDVDKDDDPKDDEPEGEEDERNEAAPRPPMELDDEEYERMRLEQEAMEEGDEEDDQISLPLPPPVRRQTFIYSATLTLPPTTPSAKAKVAADKKKKKSKQKGSNATTVEGAIAELLEKARAKGPTKIVDLTTATNKNSRSNPPSDVKSVATAKNPNTSTNTNTSSSRLPPGLTLEQITCTQMHKDSHLYAYLVTTNQGASGPALVFCNSILAVRRVGATLQTLGLNVRILHAHMPQVR